MKRSALKLKLSLWVAKCMKYWLCALVSQIPNVCEKKKLEPQLNQNDATDRNLWKSLSVPAGIALESRFNNTCVLPKRCDVANARQFVEKSERLERARVVGKKDGLWQESSITKGKMRIKSHAWAGL